MCAEVHLEVEFEFEFFQVLFANVSTIVWSPRGCQSLRNISPFTARNYIPSHPHDNGEDIQTVSECNLEGEPNVVRPVTTLSTHA